MIGHTFKAYFICVIVTWIQSIYSKIEPVPIALVTLRTDYINKMKSTAAPLFIARLMNEKIPNFDQEGLGVSNIKIEQLSLDVERSTIEFTEPSTVKFTLSGINIFLKGDFRYRKSFFRTSGRLMTRITNGNFFVVMKLKRDRVDHSKLDVELINSKLNPGKFDVSLHGNFLTWILNRVISLFKKRIVGILDDKITKDILPGRVMELNTFLDKLNMQSTVNKKKVKLYFSQDPILEPEKIIFALSANLNELSNSSISTKIPNPLDYSFSKGCTVIINEVLLDAAGKFLHQLNKTFFDYDPKIGEELRNKLKKEDMAELIPLNMSALAWDVYYPNISWNIGNQTEVAFKCWFASNHSLPNITIKSSSIHAEIEFACSLSDNKTGEFYFGHEFSMDFRLKPIFDSANKKIKTEILSFDYKYASIPSAKQSETAVLGLLYLLKLGSSSYTPEFSLPPLPKIRLENFEFELRDSIIILKADPFFQDDIAF